MTHELSLTATTPCLSCPLRELDLFKDRNKSEVAFIQQLKSGEHFAPAGTTIVRENAHTEKLFTVLSGWVFKYRTLEGNRRQIINYGPSR